MTGRVFRRSASPNPPVAVAAHGSTIVDTEGREYLDAAGGAVVVNVGHGRAEIVAGVCAPLSREAPNLIRVLIDVILNADDGLPARVGLPFGCHLSWEDPLGSSYGL